MNSRIWASLDDYLHPSAGGGWLGRNMANYYFISALFRYGTFDEYHFFLANAAHRQLFLKIHGTLIAELGLEERVKVFERLDLPEKLQQHDYVVFHQSDHINYFSALCSLRDRLGAGFPVTAFIHSISYQEYMPKYLEMCSAGPGPFDALICSSKAGRDVLKKVFGRLREEGPPMQLPVIPLGINEQGALPSKDDARSALGMDPDVVVGLCFGRFSELDKMDLFPLLQAFREIGPTPDHKLYLAGAVHSEHYMEMLKLWIGALGLEKAVRILTNPSELEKNNLFAAADFFVSLSDNPQETFGLTVLEAESAGLPLLVSDFDGYKELVTDDVGFRAPTLWYPMPGLDALQPLMDERTFHLFASQSIAVDNEFVSNALLILFRDAALRQKMGQAARMRFSACYTHASTIRRLEGLWSELKFKFQKADESAVDTMSLNTFESFSHYTSRVLSDEARIQTTEFGRQILAKKTIYPLLPGMAKLVDSRVVIALMLRAEKSILLKELFASEDFNAEQDRYIVLWMIKHGLLRAEIAGAS